MNLAALPRRIDGAGRWATIAIGCSIPFSVALDNVLLLVVLVCWIAGGNYAQKRASFIENPVSLCALGLFTLLLLGTLWGNQPYGDARHYLLKYLDLVFVPLLIYYFRDPVTRQRGLLALAGALMLMLELSFLVKAGILSTGELIEGTPISPVVFKFRVTHNFLMAFGAFLFMWLAIAAPAGSRSRIGWWILAALAAFNVTMMVEGATGYLTLGALGLMMAITRMSRRALFAASLALAVFVSLPSPLLQRAATLTVELQLWQPGVAARNSSSGLRLEFYRNTLDIISEHPITGTGTGGFPSAYAARVQGTAMLPSHNPHNEYLMIAAQLGLLGLGVMGLLFFVQWRTAPKLPTQLERNLARGLVLAMVVGCAFNSFLLDHAEGLFYAWLTALLYAGLPASTKSVQPA